MDRSRRTDRARELRLADWLAEKQLWAQLRGRRLAGLKFRRQHPIGPYFADFACIEARLVVEVDGLSHGQAPSDADQRRELAIERAGWLVVRVTNRQVLEELAAVLRRIADAAAPGREAQ